MFKNRRGRPRSWISAASESTIAASAHSFERRASRGRPVSCGAGRQQRGGAGEAAREQIPGDLALLQTGGLMIGVP